MMLKANKGSSCRLGGSFLSLLVMVLVMACQQEIAPVDEPAAVATGLPADEYSHGGDYRDGDTTDGYSHDEGYHQGRDELSSQCRYNSDCRDGDTGTIDWCYRGDCYHQERDRCEDSGSHCSHNSDCRDGDTGTIDWCYQHQCHHAERDTGECVEEGLF